MLRRLAVGAAVAMTVLSAAPAEAQDPDAATVPQFYFGVQGQYARPVGEFRDYVKHGGGINVNFALPIPRGGAFSLRADGGFIVYGSETREVCFSQTVGCRILLELTTTNSIGYLNIGPQLMLPDGPVRPYVNAAIGGSYFGTSSSVSGTDANEDDFASTTNFDDITFAWTGGGGILISLSRGRTPVLLDLGMRYHGNGEAEYLKKGDITDNPDGTLTINPTRSEANLLTFKLGVQIGASPGSNQ